jgi:hypothetical protein
LRHLKDFVKARKKQQGELKKGQKVITCSYAMDGCDAKLPKEDCKQAGGDFCCIPCWYEFMKAKKIPTTFRIYPPLSGIHPPPSEFTHHLKNLPTTFIIYPPLHNSPTTFRIYPPLQNLSSLTAK